MKKEVSLPGFVVEVTGDERDGYFQEAERHASGLTALARFVQRQLKADACIADVGANIGLTALMMSRLRPDGHVFAFEPSPTTAAALRANVEASGFGNITVIEAAVGAQPGSVNFAHAEHYSAGSRVAPDGAVSVPIIRLDDFCIERGIDFNFLKIDVEGYEPWALAGFRKKLNQETPLWMEFNSLCLTACGANTLAFALAIVESFEARRAEPNGDFTPLVSGHTFTYENMTQRGCVDDVLLRLKSGSVLPSLATMTGQTLDVAEKDIPASQGDRGHAAATLGRSMDYSNYENELSAVYASKSWRMTAPLRLVANMLGRGKSW